MDLGLFSGNGDPIQQLNNSKDHMKIAFVGKGGSGKTTLSALFSQYIRSRGPVLVIDADVNIHLPALLGYPEIPPQFHASHPEAVRTIKEYLRGNNHRIAELAHFRKTTPPAAGSRLIGIHDVNNPILQHYSVGSNDYRLLVVGTYDTDDIGASCYHNNLAIAENIISHLADHRGNLVTDMVAGVDAFANTLHAQFDLLILSVEPTQRGVEVYRQYHSLATEAGVGDTLYVVGNKVRNAHDEKFISSRIPQERIIGFFGESEYLRSQDQEGGPLRIASLDASNLHLLGRIADRLFSRKPDYRKRQSRMHELHLRYVGQDFIRERFGDLRGQIDPEFDLEKAVLSYDHTHEA